MRILWASNAPYTPTGYGTQTAQVVRRLAKAGHKVAVAANYGLAGTKVGWEEGVILYPTGIDAYGNDILPDLFARWQESGDGEPTLLLTLYDVWAYSNPKFRELPIASWTPVDHLEVPPEVKDWAQVHQTIAMSRFGQEQFAKAGIKAHYVPHAIDTSVFRPYDREMRAAMEVPDDAFLVMVNAANKGKMPPRKAWGEMLAAYALFAHSHPDAILYLHADMFGHDGIPLQVLLGSLGITAKQIRIVPQDAYRLGEVTQTMLARLYSAADVLLSTSFGEGFGLAVLEAQACGTPVIVNNVTAQPELCGAGWQVQSQRYWDFTQGAWFGIPLIDSIVEALESAYEQRGDPKLREQAVAFASQYEADAVFETYWKPTLAALEQAITPSRQQRRAAARRKAKAA